MQYSLEQVLKMAPDDASAKAGQQLAVSSKWSVAAVHDKALWGDCQGSGKLPYKTIVDLGNIAFRCSCPSRKFPCKHGLGLMLLYVRQPDAFSHETNLPPHVDEWLNKREQKDVAKATKEEKPVDEAAKAKRAESREKKVNAGIEELRSWIKDIARTGIMNVPQQQYQFTENITARMVDAQAGGLASQLRQINRINFFEDGWQRSLIKRLSSIYLITEAYGRISDLPEDMMREIQTLIGWTVAKETVLQNEELKDHWLVLSVTTTEESNIETERIWLYGTSSKQYALILNFYAGNQLPQHLLVPGMVIEAGIVYFPGLEKLRALIKDQPVVTSTKDKIDTAATISAVYEDITKVLSVNPFREQIPFLASGLKIVLQEKNWLLTDKEMNAITINNPADECWLLLAFTKGKSFDCFGMYENEKFQVHQLWLDGKNYFLK